MNNVFHNLNDFLIFRVCFPGNQRKTKLWIFLNTKNNTKYNLKLIFSQQIYSCLFFDNDILFSDAKYSTSLPQPGGSSMGFERNSSLVRMCVYVADIELGDDIDYFQALNQVKWVNLWSLVVATRFPLLHTISLKKDGNHKRVVTAMILTLWLVFFIYQFIYIKIRCFS